MTRRGRREKDREDEEMRKKAGEDRLSKKLKQIADASGSPSVPLREHDDGPFVLLDRKLFLEKMKCLGCPSDEQVLASADAQLLGTELSIDLGQAML